MAEFVNTVDVIGDDALTDSIISKTITELYDNTLAKIGNYAFYVCRALTTADFPLVTSIGNYAFCYCTALTSVNFPAATSIGNSAFYECSELTTADFPATTSIDNNAFHSCKVLTTADFPLVTSIGSNVFHNCKVLTSVNFPAATSIGSSAFYGCSSLTTADFPAATSIGDNVFYECSVFTALILRNTEKVATLRGTYVFDRTPIKSGTGYIYVPRDLVGSYKRAVYWSTYANQFRALEDYTVDGTITGELDPTKI